MLKNQLALVLTGTIISVPIEFIALFGAAMPAWPLSARAQQAERVRRIGVLMGYAESDPEAQANVAAFREGLQKLGWAEGRNIRIDTRWPIPADVESMQRFATELMALEPDVILSHITPTTAALLQQTRTIPIVFATVSDPVGSGFVANFPRPGQRHRFHQYRANDCRQVAGAAQGDCAARRSGGLPVQPGNRALRILPELLQSRRSLLRRGSDRSPGSRQVRARTRHYRTGTRAEWWPSPDDGYFLAQSSPRKYRATKRELLVSRLHFCRWRLGRCRLFAQLR